MTIIFHCEKVRDKVLLISFIFESSEVTVDVARNRVVGCSLDKYLGPDDWSGIFGTIKHYVDAYVDHNARIDASFELRGLSLELEWKGIEPHDKAIVADNLGDDAIRCHDHVMTVVVKHK